MTQSQSSVIKFSFFLFFIQPEVSDNKPGWMRGITLPKIWLHSSNNLEILLVNVLSPQLLHDTKSIFCHQVQFFLIFLWVGGAQTWSRVLGGVGGGALLILYSKIAEFWGPSSTLSAACGWGLFPQPFT